MTRIWYLAMGLLFACWLAALLYGQPEHLGTLHCADDQQPVWIIVLGRLEGHSTERRLPLFVCLEDYQAMNER